jgi:hypothetical protein
MADLSDITALFASMAAATIYPNGNSQPSIINGPVKIFEGWPIPEIIDLDMRGQMLVNSVVAPTGVGPICSVSVYPMPNSGALAYQILDEPYIVVPPVHGLTPTIIGGAIALSGTPGTGEFVTLILDKHVYSRGGASISAILAALLTDVLVDYPTAYVSGNSLMTPATHVTARIGAPATMAQVTHRQIESVMVTVWTPDPERRTALVAPLDVMFKKNLRVALPDTSYAIIRYQKTNSTDAHQTVGIYQRDLIYTVEFATLDTFPVVEVTAIVTNIGVDVSEDMLIQTYGPTLPGQPSPFVAIISPVWVETVVAPSSPTISSNS